MNETPQIAVVNAKTGGGIEGRRRTEAEAATLRKRRGINILAATRARRSGVGGYQRIEASGANRRPRKARQRDLADTALIGEKGGK
jgi:hypothetical protein